MSQLTAERLYTNYWENDATANPKIVRVLPDTYHNDFVDVILPNNEGQRQVHIHHLGRFHRA